MTSFKNKLATAKEQVRDAYLNGATMREIAEVHGVSPGTVRNTLIELGVNRRRPGRKAGKKKEKELLPVKDLTDPTPEVVLQTKGDN